MGRSFSRSTRATCKPFYDSSRRTGVPSCVRAVRFCLQSARTNPDFRPCRPAGVNLSREINIGYLLELVRTPIVKLPGLGLPTLGRQGNAGLLLLGGSFMMILRENILVEVCLVMFSCATHAVTCLSATLHTMQTRAEKTEDCETSLE